MPFLSMRRMRRGRYRVVLLVLVLCTTINLAAPAGAWGIHSLITRVAVELLPAWQRKALGDQQKPFIDRYCVFPDAVRDADAAPYVLKFPPEAKISHHIPAGLNHQKQLFDAYLPRIAGLLKEKNTTEAMRFFGSVAHFLEDSSAPCHMAYGETRVPDEAAPMLVIDFFKRFMPLPEQVERQQLHSRIDGCPMTYEQLYEAAKNHKPRLLGHSIEELTFNLLEEHARMNRRASKQLIPMLQALADDDEKAFVAAGVPAAAEGAWLVADVLFTMLSISHNQFEQPQPATLSLAGRLPLSGSAFAWSDKNHVGQLLYNQSGSLFNNFGEPAKLGRQPLRLKVEGGEVRQFAQGFGVGWRSEYTFYLPHAGYSAFSVLAGNDAELGRESVNTFEILLDGKPAAKTPKLKGIDAPAVRLEVALGEANTITLRCQSDCPPSKTHGVWAEPTLRRSN